MNPERLPESLTKPLSGAVFGSVQHQAMALGTAVQGFEHHARRLAGFDPVFDEYEGFAPVPGRLSRSGFRGCRRSGCLNGASRATTCVRDRVVDFCYQCGDFPCADHGLQNALRDRREDHNRRMLAEGPAVFFARLKGHPRYKAPGNEKS